MRKSILLLLATGALVAVPPAQTAKPPVTLTVVVGKKGVSGGTKSFTVKRYAWVELVVRSAIGETIHVHGYDLERKIVAATKPVIFRFTARLVGVFEVELHLHGGRDLRIAAITVR